MCCLVSAAAIPPDAEAAEAMRGWKWPESSCERPLQVPMMLSVCFLVCFPKAGAAGHWDQGNGWFSARADR